MYPPRTPECTRSSFAGFVLGGRSAVRRPRRLTAPNVSPREARLRVPNAGRAWGCPSPQGSEEAGTGWRRRPRLHLPPVRALARR